MTTENNNFGDEDTSYQAAGGIEGIQQLVNDFYDLMDSLGSVGLASSPLLSLLKRQSRREERSLVIPNKRQATQSGA